MIPKTIHYCWFGGKPLPSLAVKCLESWKKYLPEYEIKEWNEDNFPLEKFQFAQEALENKKFAFVSDVCRLYALKMEGGVYMDTDVEVLKSLNVFLKKTAFSGFENDDFVPTGIMASEKGGKWVDELLEYYNGRSFIKDDGSFDVYCNTKIITDMMIAKGYIMNNKFQEKENYVSFYPNEYFCPKSYKTGLIELTDNSYCIHHFAGSGTSKYKRWKNSSKIKLINIIGLKNSQKLFNLFK